MFYRFRNTKLQRVKIGQAIVLVHFLHSNQLLLIKIMIEMKALKRGGVRIMDLDQYLEKMNTNTKII